MAVMLDGEPSVKEFNNESLPGEFNLPDSYYDETDLSNIYDMPVVLEDPTWRELKEIRLFKTFNRGVMLVTGAAGSGKDLFGVPFTYLNKRYFGRRVLLDFKPRRLFGTYTLIKPQIMAAEVSKIARLAATGDNGAKGLTDVEQIAFADASNDWMEKNQHLFKDSIVYLSELRRYCYRRLPHNRVNKLIGAINTQWRHWNMLVLGTHIQAEEIDRFTFMANVTHRVMCEWMVDRLNTTRALIIRERYLADGYGVFNATRKGIAYYIDGAKPRSFLGGHCFYELYNTQADVNLRPSIGKEVA